MTPELTAAMVNMDSSMERCTGVSSSRITFRQPPTRRLALHTSTSLISTTPNSMPSSAGERLSGLKGASGRAVNTPQLIRLSLPRPIRIMATPTAASPAISAAVRRTPGSTSGSGCKYELQK